MMDTSAVEPVRAWMRTFDTDGTGIASRSDLEPALRQILDAKDTNMLLRSFQVGDFKINYELLLAFLFEQPDTKGILNNAIWLSASDTQQADVRSAELAWLQNLSTTIPSDIRKVIVSHRGFHCTDGRTKRPIENTLPAYEQAWSSGVEHCKADIQLTSDGFLVLNHDDDLSRLALLMQKDRNLSFAQTTRPTTACVSELPLKQLISTPMKSGIRQPLLKEVLDVAVAHGSAQLVIEVKPGGKRIAEVLTEFFKANQAYLNHVPVVMSFDPDVAFKFANGFPATLRRPKVMLLTTKKSAPPTEPYEQLLDFDKGDIRPDVERMITRNGTKLDGVYVEWTEKLLGKSSKWLQKLCEECTVGMWQNKGEPDCLGVCTELSRLGVSFVNTDFPKGFLGKYTGKVQPEERLPNSLFASIAPAPDGSAGGVWKERPRRKDMIKALQEREFDILIIGGGATGLGTALEATRQGYSVVLLEKGDFACGTSSKSSNMLHGGTRYLQACVQNPNTAAEQIDVVRKGLAEQTYMYNCAPYNLRPYPCMVACYAEKERDLYGKLLYEYDELGDDNPLPESNWNTKKETLFRFPLLRQEGLIGSFIYYDGQQDDARMATLIALTAIENGAVISNYLEVRSLIKEDGITKGAVVADTDVADGETFDVRAKVVVNATGPFTDVIRKMDEGQGVQNIIKPAAGTHVILPDHFSPDRCGLSILETSDGRALFYLPWMGQTIVGTTDSVSEIKPFLSPPEADIKWIIQEANRYLDPNISPATEEDVLAAWVGVRPLFVGSLPATGTKDVVPMQLAEDSKGASGDDTKSVSREHAVIVSESRLVTITGGNWTSYRHMAQDTVEEAVKTGKLPALKKQNVDGRPAFEQGFVGSKKGPNVDYDKLQLASAAPFHSDVVELQSKWRFQRDIAENLVASYGTHAIEVACIARRGERMGFAQRLAEGYPWIMAQVVYGARREYACTIPDVLSRRTRLAQIDVLAAYDAIPRIADVMADELQWSQERILREIKEAERFLESCGLDFCRKRHMNVKSQSTATSAA